MKQVFTLVSAARAVLALGLALPLVARGADTDRDGAATDRPALSTDRPSLSTDRPALPVAHAPSAGTINVTGLGDLPFGKTLTIVFQASVDNVAFPAGKNNLSTQGTVTGGNITPLLTDDPAFPGAADPTLTPLAAAPDLQLGLTDGGASTVPGGTVTYALTYANAGTPGSQGATGVVLATTVPADTTFNAGASTVGWSCLPDNTAGSACTLTVGALAAGGSGGANFAVTVSDPVAAGVTQIAVSAAIADDAANGPDSVLANNTAADTTPLTAQPDIALTKSDGGASVAPGGTVAYTLTYSNVGNQGATGIVLTETVPSNTTFNAGASTAGWVCAPDANPGSICTLNVAGTLAGGGASGVATFALTAADPIPAGVTQISNTASAADDAANGPDPNGGNNSGSDTTPIAGAPDLGLTKSDGGGSAVPGGTVTYALGYGNTGNRGATGVALTETVPANATFNAGASTAGWVCVPDNNAGSTCTLTVGAVPAAPGAGSSGSVNFAVTVANPVAAGVTQISNTSSVADDGTNGTDPNAGNNSANDTTPVDATPDFSVTKSDGGASVAPGGTVAYTLNYANGGNQGGAGVVLTETVPANTTFNAGASTAGWVCVPNNNAGSSCSLTVGGLNGGGAAGSATFAVTVDNPVPAGVTQVSNTASLADDGANGADPTPGNNSSTDTTPITGAPDVSVTKSDGGASATPGASVSYTLDYSNNGNRGATGVTLTETIPANTTFDAGPSTIGWVCVPDSNPGSTCTLTIGSVPAAPASGSTGSATFAVLVANPVAAGVTQVSNASTIAEDGTNGPDPNTANNTGSDTTPVTAAPDFTLTKTDGGASVNTGATVSYSLNYANAGNQGATGVTLTESVPLHTVFNPGASTAGWVCVPDNTAGSTCTLTVGALSGGGANGSATFAATVNTSVPSGVTQISNTASITDDAGNGPDPTPGDNTGSDTTPLVAVPDVSLTKTDDRVVVLPGQVLTYTLSVLNNGSQDATGVVVTETVLADTTFVPSQSTAGWVCVPDNNAGSTCTFNLAGSVVPGAPAQTVVFALQASNPGVPGTLLTNTASVADDGSNGPDPNSANNTGTDTTRLVPKGDFNANGHADILFQNDASERLVIWLMETVPAIPQLTRFGGLFTSPQDAPVGFKAAATGDFNLDGQLDIVFQRPSDGGLRIWLMNGATRLSELTPTPGQMPSADWEVAASGDFNADVWPDLVLRNKVTSAIEVWLMNGTTQISAGPTTPAAGPGAGWRIVGAANFNLGTGPFDTLPDLLWRNNTSGNAVVWYMNGLIKTTGEFLNPPSVGGAWEIVAVADYNEDNHADVLWRNGVSGRFVCWYMNGKDRVSGNFTNPDSAPGSPDPSGLSWRIVGPK